MATSSPKEPRRRGRPPLLSPDAIVDAAVEIGIEDFTMQDIAQRLGVVSQALYRWVADREELLDMVADRVVSRITPPPARPGQDWQAWLDDFAHALRDELADWPGIAARGLTRYHVSVAFVTLHARVVDTLTQGGLEPPRALKVAEIFGTCVLGWIAREQALTSQHGGGRRIAEEIRAARTAAGLPAAGPSAPRASRDERFDELVTALIAACAATT